jgi:cyclophilin family peptidyl-prolyl cis-trans isomerase
MGFSEDRMRLPLIGLMALLLSAAPALAQDASPPPVAPVQPAPLPDMVGPQILISSSMGDMTLQLDAVRAPKTVANVLSYVKAKHYDGTVFYRVVKGFVIQMGSWDANVKGRPPHAPVQFEGANGLSNRRGTVALAHGDDPNSGTADFFVNMDDNSGLDHVEGDPQKIGFTVFGKVISGMEIADAISQVATGDKGPMPGQAPIDPILIKKVSILPSETWKAQCAAGAIPASSCEAAINPTVAAAKKPAAKQPDSKTRRSGP